MAASKPTPMMEQYHALTREAGECLLFYRMGDFFELFFDDAKIAAGVRDIALTSRGESGGEAVPMCGVPVHSADGYLARLIRAGHRVAIAAWGDEVERDHRVKACFPSYRRLPLTPHRYAAVPPLPRWGEGFKVVRPIYPHGGVRS